ncbi:MAG: leucine-rich repeat protein [Bacteroidales bacterium]|jgi:hypothetical protein|nr:leucine-rich repeat protein [Bacteroidales bacterium]
MKNFLSPVKNAVITAACILMLASCKEDKLRNSADIIAFTVDGVAWTISGTDITCTYPTETQEGPLTPVIALSPGATVSPASGTAQNFFTPQGVAYTVTAEDGVTKKTYTAKATRTPKTAADITAFTVGGVEWTISGTDITYTYPSGTQEGTLTPVITLSSGATVSPVSGPAQNFFTPQGVAYTVTAEDGVTTKTYTAKAVIIVASGATGDCFWTIAGVASSYTLTIIGNGAMGDYSYENPSPWEGYRTEIGTLIIHEGVTTVGDNAFFYCSGLTSITIPNSVTTIGDGAFSVCSGLTSVTIPNSVTTIGEGAFSGCRGLISVTIPNSVTTIGESAFSSCLGLTSVTIPNSVTIIGDGVFYYCSGLTSVTIPNTVTFISRLAFYYCIGLTSVTIGNSVTTIGDYAFYNCIGLTSVTNLSATPQIISSGVFQDVTLSGLTLKVPAASVTDYQAAPVWEDFGTIEAL